MERSAMIRSYDLVVIGAGPAGESAAELAAFLGHNVVIVEIWCYLECSFIIECSP